MCCTQACVFLPNLTQHKTTVAYILCGSLAFFCHYIFGNLVFFNFQHSFRLFLGNDVVDDRALYLISLIQEVFINNDRALKLNSLLDLMLLDFPDIFLKALNFI